MPLKKTPEGDSKRLGRNTRRNRTKEKNSLDEILTLVGQRPQDTIQERTSQEILTPIRENIITASAASTSNCNRHKDSSGDSSNDSDLER